MKKIFLLLILSTNIFAINQTEFIKLLKENHPFFMISDYNQKNLIIAKKIANPYQDWNFNNNTQYTQNISNNENSSIFVNSLTKKNISGSNIGLSSTINQNTTAIKNYNHKLELNYSIPLQKNKDGINDQLNLDLAEIDLKIGTLQTIINNNNFINTQVKKLFNMKYLEHKVSINQKQLIFVKEQLSLIKAKYKQNLVDKTDILLQQNNYQNQVINVLSSIQELNSITQELQNLIGVKITTNAVNLKKIDDVDKNFIISNLRAIKIIQLNQQKIQRVLKSLYNKKKSQVDLALGASVNKQSDAILGNGNYDDSISIGLEIALPFGGTANKNLILQQLNALNTTKSNERQTIIEIKNQKNNILAKLKILKNIIEINQQQIKITTNGAKEHQITYDNGNTELRFVIDAKNKQQQAQLVYFANLLQYKNLQLDYQNLAQ